MALRRMILYYLYYCGGEEPWTTNTNKVSLWRSSQKLAAKKGKTIFFKFISLEKWVKVAKPTVGTSSLVFKETFETLGSSLGPRMHPRIEYKRHAHEYKRHAHEYKRHAHDF